MNKFLKTIQDSILHWNSLPNEIFVSLYRKGKKEVVLIKFRETVGTRSLFNEVEPWRGIKFIDAMGTGDYFLGEYVLIDKLLWNTVVASQSIILIPKNGFFNSRELEKIRDDGFIKTYSTTNNSLVIAKV